MQLSQDIESVISIKPKRGSKITCVSIVKYKHYSQLIAMWKWLIEGTARTITLYSTNSESRNSGSSEETKHRKDLFILCWQQIEGTNWRCWPWKFFYRFRILDWKCSINNGVLYFPSQGFRCDNASWVYGNMWALTGKQFWLTKSKTGPRSDQYLAKHQIDEIIFHLCIQNRHRK